MKKIAHYSILSSALLIGITAAQPLHALTFEAIPSPSSIAAPTDDSAYAAGTRAMNDHRWPDAVREFDRVAATKGSRADAALYWKAYSLNKMSRRTEAAASCDVLRAQFSASSWNKDCGALTINIHTHLDMQAGQPIPPIPPVHVDTRIPRGPDEDIKILALNSLLNQDPARALPILRGILSGSQPESVKKQAIFVLAQSKSPESQSILHDLVIGKLDPGLQHQAIEMMAVFQGKRSNDTLVEVYRTSTDIQIKKTVISALFITQDAPHLVELARAEKNLDLKRSIVSQLALMHDQAATDYMLELLK